MVSLTTNHFSSPFFTDLTTHLLVPCFYIVNLRTGVKKFHPLGFSAAGGSGFGVGFCQVKRSSSWLRGGEFAGRCMKEGEDWGSEEDSSALEEEILEFMKVSEKPEAFPSKKELMDAGRMDIVEAIMKEGGWLALGWDSDGVVQEVEMEKVWVGEETDLDYDDVDEQCDEVDFGEEVEVWRPDEVADYGVHSSYLVSSSGRSLDEETPEETETETETESEEDCVIGLEGILKGLEKERNMKLGLALRKNGVRNNSFSGSSMDMEASNLERRSRGLVNNSSGKLYENQSVQGIDGLSDSSSVRPEMWRTWSMQRAGFEESEFEAAEIDFNDLGELTNVSTDELLEMEGVSSEPMSQTEESGSSDKEIDQNSIRCRILHLESELSAVLQSLKSDPDEEYTENDHESSSDDLRELSDACEFQETEILNAQDKLRSLRAKLAVIRGKRALAIIDAKRVAEGKQKLVRDASRALRLLRTACVVWPNSASEVVLVGSFDGWTSQRKMEKSETGVFSLSLKLYPGKYEIKFIVDGEWKIDPLRPIVDNEGHKNNLLIVA